MTPEQSKQLKKGEKILIEAEFWGIHTDGDIQFGFPCKSLSGYRQMTGEYVIPEHVSLMPKKPKYDPCRRFKRGDIVRMVERMGRMECTVPVDEFFQTRPLTVIEDERIDTNLVKVESEDGRTRLSHWWYLELVTPVEEMEPYSVCQDAEMECFEVYNCEYTEDEEGNEKVWKIVRTTYFYGDNQGLRTLAEAKAAAEAERDRLNAEHRKESGK